MKKLILIFATALSLCAGAFAVTQSSDVVLFNDIKLSYQNGYYPGVIEKISQFESAYPESSFIKSALLIKAKSYFYIQNYDSALQLFNQLIENVDDNNEKAECYFLMGKSYYCKKDFVQALSLLHKSCQLAKSEENLTVYNPAVLYAAKSYYQLDQYESASKLYEYVIKHGKNYSVADYNDSLQKIMLSYNNCGSEKKTVSLFGKLNEQNFDSELYNTLFIYSADAKRKIGKTKEAYDDYCKIIGCGNEKLAIVALKKAYVLSTEANIGVNPGEIFAQAVDTFKENPDLVNEFWIRLGIDEYKNKNYKKSEEYFASVESETPIITIYKAKILLDRDNNPAKAEELLLPIENEVRKSTVDNISDSYYAILLECKFQQKKWNDITSVFGKIKNPDEKSVYILSAYYYQKKDYKKVGESTGLLYASALCKNGDYTKACGVYAELKNVSIDYAKALFACGRYSEAYEIAKSSKDLQKEYVCGICQVNLRNWELAKNHFTNYIKQASGKPEFNKLGLFYKGYTEYCLEDYKNSYNSFVRYGSEAPSTQIRYLRQGYEYAAKAALQNGDFKSAAIQAENVVRNSVTTEEKQKAVLFGAEVYTDNKDYEKALEILSPYINEKNDFAAQTLFMTAKIYEKKNNLSQADNIYERIINEFSRTEYAEEAAYRTGEVFYTHEDYATALNRFTTYIYKYASGKFSDAAMFFGGDCALRIGEIDKTVMLTNTMLQKYTNSVYAYGANKNLLAAYEIQENYVQALEVAKLLVKNYPEQAADDQIGKKLIQIEKLVGGTDKRVVEKQSEYEKAKGVSTKKGRIAGTQLVQLYAENSYTQKDAFDLAMEILPKQTAADERIYAASNAEFIADYYRKNTENQKAAQMYLTAAEYYRSIDNSEKAAVTLYGAAEAFSAEGMMGDARETAALLKQLYPESRQAQKVDRIIK